MTRILNSNIAAVLAATSFANVEAPAKKGGAPKAEDRIAPVFTAVKTDIPIPAAAKRGGKSEIAIKLDELPVNGSIGLVNKTKNQISSTLSKVNNAKENMRQKVDAAGAPVFTPGAPIKDANGAVIGQGQPVAEMERIKEFQAFTVDPKKDPDKAQTRIFRVK
jgi:hypothetical protein